MAHVVILGAGYAGQLAAGRLARSEHKVTVINARQEFVERVRLHQAAASGRGVTQPLAPRLERMGVHFVCGTALEVHDDHVVVRTSQEIRQVAFDQLVWAIGSTVKPPAGCHNTATLPGARALHQALRTASSARVAVVGFGLTGIETAAELAAAGAAKHVDLLGAGQISDDFSPAAAAHIERHLHNVGVTVRSQARVHAVQDGTIYTNLGEHDADLVVWCGGFTAPDLPRACGLPVNSNGQICVDERMRVIGRANMFAVGDIATMQGAPWHRQSCALAMPMGAWLGAHLPAMLRGERVAPFRFASAIRCVGVGGSRAVVQFTDATGEATTAMSGPLASLTKGFILRYTLWAPALEQRAGRNLYTWPRGPHQPLLAEAT